MPPRWSPINSENIELSMPLGHNKYFGHVRTYEAADLETAESRHTRGGAMYCVGEEVRAILSISWLCFCGVLCDTARRWSCVIDPPSPEQNAS